MTIGFWLGQVENPRYFWTIDHRSMAAEGTAAEGTASATAEQDNPSLDSNLALSLAKVGVRACWSADLITCSHLALERCLNPRQNPSFSFSLARPLSLSFSLVRWRLRLTSC